MSNPTLPELRARLRKQAHQARKVFNMRKPENDPEYKPSRDLPLHTNDSTMEMNRSIRRGSEELIEALRREHPEIIAHLTRGKNV